MNETTNISIPELVWDVANIEFQDIFTLIDLIENKLNNEIKVREKKIKKFQKKYSEYNNGHYNIVENFLIDEHITSISNYPNIIFKSILISGYSLLEIRLNKLCQSYKKSYPKKIKLNLNDISGKGIDRAIKYLEKVIGYHDLQINEYWEKITLWREVRNAIIHNDSYIKEENKKNRIIDILNIKFKNHYCIESDNNKSKECIAYISLENCKSAIICFANYLQLISEIPEIKF